MFVGRGGEGGFQQRMERTTKNNHFVRFYLFAVFSSRLFVRVCLFAGVCSRVFVRGCCVFVVIYTVFVFCIESVAIYVGSVLLLLFLLSFTWFVGVLVFTSVLLAKTTDILNSRSQQVIPTTADNLNS